MEPQTGGTYERVVVPPSALGTDRIADDRVVYAEPGTARAFVPYPDVAVGENLMAVRDRVQWGPIAAGAFSALSTLLFLTVLGLAVGASALEPGSDVSDWGTEAGIWGAASAIAAFLVGGWVAARTAAVDGSFAGVMNGLMAGAVTLVALVVLTSTGLTNLTGFLGGNLNDLANYAADVVQGDQTAAEAEAAFDNIRDSAWGTLAALALCFGAAALGGYAGHHKRRDLIAGTG
jgi:hypothetical protein